MTTPVTFQVNTPFIPRIVAAFRSAYPDTTAGLADGPAVKAVIKQFIRDTVAAYETQQAIAPIAAQIQTASVNWQTAHDAQMTQSQTDVGVNIT